LQNLIQNAQQAFAEVEGRSFELRVSLELRGQRLVLVVQDNGTGIAAENQNKIFDLNFSTRSQGLGLGLAMARAIVEQHGGTLRLLQSSVEGSTFEWALPVCKPNSDTSDS
jgi:signal transduction histidine kinase